MRTLLLAVLIVVGGCKKDAESVKVTAVEPVPAVKKAPAAAVPSSEKQPDGTELRVISMKVTEDGFVPGRIAVKNGESLKMKITRVTDATCATEILIDGTDIKAELPLNKEVEVAFKASKTGSVKFGCAMDKMVSGILLVE